MAGGGGGGGENVIPSGKVRDGYVLLLKIGRWVIS